MELTVQEVSPEQVRVGYVCECGCRPKVRYERGEATKDSRCCCGLLFVVAGVESATPLLGVPEERVTKDSFPTPWGEQVTAAWITRVQS